MRFSRRQFVLAGILGATAVTIGYSRYVEPYYVKVRRMAVGNGPRKLRAVHFSDFHYKGDLEAGLRLMKLMNDQSPDMVFFTGDVVEHKSFAQGALDLIQKIDAPVFGSPGNHDLVSGIGMSDLVKTFANTKGNWLWESSKWVTPSPGVTLSTVNWWESPPPAIPPIKGFHILLCHYPAFIDKLPHGAFDLILAGHSHGGQIRIPGFGAILLPYGVGRYELGEYPHPSGLLNVTSGIGWVHIPHRLFCQPEIVVIDLQLPA